MLTSTSTAAFAQAMVTAPPWALYSWPTVFLRADAKCPPRFKHLTTRVVENRRLNGPSTGHTVWGQFSAGGDAGLAWDWIEVADGVVAMVDPMRVMTNMQILNIDGRVLSASEAALHFNQFVRRLRWQQQVRRLLAACAKAQAAN